MKNTLTVFVVIFCFTVTYGQNEAPPEYLLNEILPDSVTQFQVQNIKGNKISFKEILEKNKGNKIVFDFWATWCKDCLVGMPALKTLMKETENVNYVFLSFDRTEARWKKGIKKYKLGGSHYLVTEGWDNVLSDYIGLDWIPRYMIFDEGGRIILPKTIKADDKKFRAILLEK